MPDKAEKRYMITVIDYDAGNLHSVANALSAIGADYGVSRDPEDIRTADRILLPGVGSFGDAMDSLTRSGLTGPLTEAVRCGVPFLGICLGYQLLFEGSEESPGCPGLSLLEGYVRRFPDRTGMKVPHMGWNSLSIRKKDGLYRDIPHGSFMYFVHSYYVDPAVKNIVSAETDYGFPFAASVEEGNIAGMQFHPEKSGDAGLAVLRRFAFPEGRRVC